MRDELRQCVALPAITPEELPAVASEEGARAWLAERGHDPAAAPLLAAYARSIQIQERAFGARRDLAQTQVGREMCNRNGEMAALIDANNEGPQ